MYGCPDKDALRWQGEAVTAQRDTEQERYAPTIELSAHDHTIARRAITAWETLADQATSPTLESGLRAGAEALRTAIYRGPQPRADPPREVRV
jgi:hypothetical protein